MTVLRSRTIVPKTLKSPSSPIIQQSTPIKSDENPNPPISTPMSSILSSSQLGSGFSSCFQTVRRHSLRLASKSHAQDSSSIFDLEEGKGTDFSKGDGSVSDSGNAEKEKNSKMKKRSSRVFYSSCNKSRALDLCGGDNGMGNSDSDSGYVKKKKKKKSKGECIARVSDSSIEKDMDLDSTEIKENEGIENRMSEEDGLCFVEGKGAVRSYSEEKVLKGVKMGLEGDQVMEDEGKGGIQEKKMMGLGKVASCSGLNCFRRRERLVGEHKMETCVDLMLDLNSVMEDVGSEKTELGFCGDRTEEDVDKAGIEEKWIMRKDKLGYSSGMSYISPQHGSVEKGTKGGVVNVTLSLSSFSGDGDDKESMNLRLGTRIAKRRMEVVDVDSDGIEDGKGEMQLVGDSMEDCAAVEPEINHSAIDSGTTADGEKRYSKEEKGKVLLVEKDWLSIGIDANKFSPEEDPINDVFHTTHQKKRYCKEEKGKGKLVENSWLSISSKEKKLGTDTNGVVFNGEHILEMDIDLVRSKEIAEHKSGRGKDVVRRNKERFLNTAKHFASKFAHFEPNEKDDGIPIAEAPPEDEDWPGPFSTALRIIEDRAAKLNARLCRSTSNSIKVAPVIEWVPSRDRDFKILEPLVPSLQDICFSLLCKHAEAITSLEGVPDALRSKLCHWLCDSRKMDLHILGLIVSGSPSEIRMKDCSWITEEQFQNIFGGCNTANLRVLQLDQCGRCVPDYVLRDTLARSPNSLSALITISLRCAYRLSDDGLNSLASSAPSLRSINLGECSLLTSTGINVLAENLGSVLKELYMDDCQNVDAMLTLPAIKKLKHLEVLSVAGIQNVCDKFVAELIPVCGPNMKELVFAGCGKLTDTSLKVIAENCSGLRAINLVNLKNLTDLALRHLANGCRSLQVLKLRGNAFSDEGIAAFLEASGESLTDLSLNNIKEVSNNTAIALSVRCSKTLSSLDLSFCRNLMDEAIGLIVDKCLSLRLLRLFGCTQVTNKFLDGHSNPIVKIIGLKTMRLLEHLHMPDTVQSALRY